MHQLQSLSPFSPSLRPFNPSRKAAAELRKLQVNAVPLDGKIVLRTNGPKN
jgi:hypothetical protein